MVIIDGHEEWWLLHCDLVGDVNDFVVVVDARLLDGSSIAQTTIVTQNVVTVLEVVQERVVDHCIGIQSGRRHHATNAPKSTGTGIATALGVIQQLAPVRQRVGHHVHWPTVDGHGILEIVYQILHFLDDQRVGEIEKLRFRGDGHTGQVLEHTILSAVHLLVSTGLLLHSNQ